MRFTDTMAKLAAQKGHCFSKYFLLQSGKLDPATNDKRGFDLFSDVLPSSRWWYGEPDAISNAIRYAKFFSRSHMML